MSKNLTKWRISAHEGSDKPHELGGEGVRGLIKERRGKENVGKWWIQSGYLPQDGFQAAVRSSFYVITIGKLIKVDTSSVPLQVLVHTLVV